MEHFLLFAIGGVELAIISGIILLILIFFLGYYIGKASSKKKNQ